MPEEWFVDGYNVLYFLKARAPREPYDLPRLTRELAGLAVEEDARVCLVLDGKGPAQELAPYRTERLDVVYAQGVTADAWIERALVDRRGRASCVVVTSDAAIIQIARGTGARVWRPDELLERFGRSRRDRDADLRNRQAKSHRFNRPFEDQLE